MRVRNLLILLSLLVLSGGFFFIPSSFAETASTTTETEIGNSDWSLRFCAAGHPYDPTPPYCPSTEIIVGDGNNETFDPLIPGYTFEYPGSGSGTISVVNLAGNCMERFWSGTPCV